MQVKLASRRSRDVRHHSCLRPTYPYRQPLMRPYPPESWRNIELGLENSSAHRLELRHRHAENRCEVERASREIKEGACGDKPTVARFVRPSYTISHRLRPRVRLLSVFLSCRRSRSD